MNELGPKHSSTPTQLSHLAKDTISVTLKRVQAKAGTLQNN